MRSKAMKVTGLLTAVLVVLGAQGVEAHHRSWSGPVYPLNADGTPDFESPIAGGRAAYTNGEDAVSFAVNAEELDEGNGYTIWLMVYNHPENCIGIDAPDGLRCGQRDHFNPAAMFSVMYGTGKWADGASVRFTGVRDANSPLAIPDDVWLGVGLVNPAGAEVHLRVRDHGPRQACCEHDQVSTIGGGCTDESIPFGPGERGSYACADIQTTAS